MARSSEACPVCYQDYEENGYHVPRLLPCTHTQCEQCIKQLISNNKLKCPECQTEHDVKNEEKPFPLNRYILENITKRKPRVVGEECREHAGKELIMFCKEEGCQKAICVTCSLSDKHKGHEKVEIEMINDELERSIDESVERNLYYRFRNVVTAKEDLEKKKNVCLDNLKRKKDEAIRKFDEMIKQVDDKMKDVFKIIDEDLSTMKSVVNIRENKGTPRTCDDVIKGLKIIQEIDQFQHKTYEYLEYIANQATDEKLYGYFMKKEIEVDLSKLNITKASQLYVKGKFKIFS